MLRGCTGNKYCSNESSFLRHCITILTLLLLLFNRLTYFRGGWGGDWSLGVLFYSCLTAWQRPPPNKCAREAEEEADWSFQNDSWLLAWVTLDFALCALGIGTTCPTLHWRKWSGKFSQSRGTETHTEHVEAIQGQAAWASLLLPGVLQSGSGCPGKPGSSLVFVAENSPASTAQLQPGPQLCARFTLT